MSEEQEMSEYKEKRYEHRMRNEKKDLWGWDSESIQKEGVRIGDSLSLQMHVKMGDSLCINRTVKIERQSEYTDEG